MEVGEWSSAFGLDILDDDEEQQTYLASHQGLLFLQKGKQKK